MNALVKKFNIYLLRPYASHHIPVFLPCSPILTSYRLAVIKVRSIFSYIIIGNNDVEKAGDSTQSPTRQSSTCSPSYLFKFPMVRWYGGRGQMFRVYNLQIMEKLLLLSKRNAKAQICLLFWVLHFFFCFCFYPNLRD